MTGFGRKGSPTGSERSSKPQFGAAHSPSDNDQELSPQARAFLAAERSRKLAEQSSVLSSAFQTAALLQPTFTKPPKSLALAYVLWWFGGTFAAHRMYLGAFRSATTMAGFFWGGLALGSVMSKKSSLWVGGVAVPPLWAAMILAWMAWWFLDAFLIPGVRRRQAQVGSVQPLSRVFV
ncbi:TM2 domain-containing protein [Sphingosinicella sp. BN140058]|uniref:TM2 domain-containing protein n=1 Tax=Sphingosinicella sp. BN140058 TaxID=1892855 RepID=UPI0013EDA3B8|nr:TM2 domain-containing protein [Sphingosinicella sp. BN140058]